MEAVERREGLWFVDFTKLRRTRGPGKAAADAPATGFALGEEEDFSEATSLLVDPERQIAILEYNHHGVRRGTILGYLAKIASLLANEVNYYDFIPRFDSDARQRFEQRKTVRRIQAKIHPRLLNEDDYRRDGMLRDSIRSGTRTDAAVVSLGLSVGQAGRNYWLGGQANADVEELYELAKQESDGLSKLVVGFERDDQTIDTVDLVRARTKTNFRLTVDDNDRQIAMEERWNALERAWNGWKTIDGGG